MKTVRQMAKEAGVSPNLVSRKRAQGKSDEQILAEAEARRLRSVQSPPRDETFAEAQRRKESALADLRELELAEKRRELLNASEISTAVHELIATAKSRLLLIGDELGDRLAAESNPVRCRELVTDEVRRALSELSQYQVLTAGTEVG